MGCCRALPYSDTAHYHSARQPQVVKPTPERGTGGERGSGEAGLLEPAAAVVRRRPIHLGDPPRRRLLYGQSAPPARPTSGFRTCDLPTLLPGAISLFRSTASTPPRLGIKTAPFPHPRHSVFDLVLA
jgi:hypothetical protein